MLCRLNAGLPSTALAAIEPALGECLVFSGQAASLMGWLANSAHAQST